MSVFERFTSAQHALAAEINSTPHPELGAAVSQLADSAQVLQASLEASSEGAILRAWPTYSTPGGGITVWRPADSNSDDHQDSPPSITGVPVVIAPYRVLRNIFYGLNTRGNSIYLPGCVSLDRKWGRGNPGGKCSACAYRWRNDAAAEEWQRRGCQSRWLIVLVTPDGYKILDLSGAAGQGIDRFIRSCPSDPGWFATTWSLVKHPSVDDAALAVGKIIGLARPQDDNPMAYDEALIWHRAYWSDILVAWRQEVADGRDVSAGVGLALPPGDEDYAALAAAHPLPALPAGAPAPAPAPQQAPEPEPTGRFGSMVAAPAAPAPAQEPDRMTIDGPQEVLPW